MTDFEFHLTLRTVKKIKHLDMQKSEKRGRISANLQPDATKVLLKDKRSNRRWFMHYDLSYAGLLMRHNRA